MSTLSKAVLTDSTLLLAWCLHSCNFTAECPVALCRMLACGVLIVLHLNCLDRIEQPSQLSSPKNEKSSAHIFISLTLMHDMASYQSREACGRSVLQISTLLATSTPAGNESNSTTYSAILQALQKHHVDRGIDIIAGDRCPARCCTQSSRPSSFQT